LIQKDWGTQKMLFLKSTVALAGEIYREKIAHWTPEPLSSFAISSHQATILPPWPPSCPP
jgi:hypothetical protein